ncbi:hypothetical protein D4R42_00830 [bacterium]|nr:MAG: hypothetical protein D4R42_00830 [bacterium]
MPNESTTSGNYHYGAKHFETRKEFYKFLIDNKDTLITQKKAEMKRADCPVIVKTVLVVDPQKADAVKADNGTIADIANIDALKVIAVINTTNFMDSHMDVHIPGIWNKTIKDNKMVMHLQEHDMEFEKIIADGDQLKAYTKTYKWSELGYGYEGTTEALIFDSEILKDRNRYMFGQYAKGWVRNHSVGMYYVKFDLALNDEDQPNEYEAWKKYYPQIANKEVADEKGYFWYVLEAKLIEGSAVPLGSNIATPTQSVTAGKESVFCQACGHEFDYNKEAEMSLGFVNCPECGKAVAQCDKEFRVIDFSFIRERLKKEYE